MSSQAKPIVRGFRTDPLTDKLWDEMAALDGRGKAEFIRALIRNAAENKLPAKVIARLAAEARAEMEAEAS